MGPNDSCFPSLSYETRIKGFIVCFAFGWVLNLFSTAAMSFGQVNGFVMLYTIGNIASLCSTLFLMGPSYQVKKMCAKERVIATVMYFSLIVVTIIVGLKTGSTGLVIICVSLQSIAGIWYSLSYFPFIRGIICSCMKFDTPETGLGV